MHGRTCNRARSSSAVSIFRSEPVEVAAGHLPCQRRSRRLIYGFPPRKAALLPPNVDHGWILDGRDGESFVAAD